MGGMKNFFGEEINKKLKLEFLMNTISIEWILISKFPGSPKDSTKRVRKSRKSLFSSKLELFIMMRSKQGHFVDKKISS